jgi:hypothetical protein
MEGKYIFLNRDKAFDSSEYKYALAGIALLTFFFGRFVY